MVLRPSILILSFLLALLAGCAELSGAHRGAIETELSPTKATPAPPIRTQPAVSEEQPITIKHEERKRASSQAELDRGSGDFVNRAAATAPLSTAAAPEGQTTLNFENMPIQAVVQQILGALLKENYSIAPTVAGTVTFSTSKPITNEQAMPILEMLLAWTNNTLVRKQGRYEVVPIKEAVPGNLSPRIAPPHIAKGYEVRVFPLRYISATEMQKLIKPYAKADAIVSADNARSMIVMAGTAAELENYQRTVDVFDVDWLKGMSVGVFGLRNMDVAKIMPELDKIFGAAGESPLAGMFRFIPMESTNSIVVITPQRDYLEQAEKWLYRLDMGVGENGTQLYVYDVKNVKAVDLSDHLNAIFTGRTSGRSSTTGNVAPGLRPASVGGLSATNIGGTQGKTNATAMPNVAQPNISTTGTGAPNAPAAAGAKETDIRITPIEENNQLLVMATPGEWDSILAAIHRLDVSPLQVQIETKILEVSLTGEFQFGVQWYLAGLIGTPSGSAQANGNYPYAYPPGSGTSFTGNSHDRHRTSLGATGNVSPTNNGGFFYSILGRNFEAAVNALETSGNTKILSAPSLFVMNNQEAQINVGQQVPVLQTSIVGINNLGSSTTSTNPLTGGTSANNVTNTGIGSVSYISTGVRLDVKPRVNPGGLVYMDISQEVSSPGANLSVNGNPPINQRQLQTQVAVQSGETVLLGGLIAEDDEVTDNGLPLLNRVPILGRLFGNTDRKRNRTELIVLITPKVITSADDARNMTDEYRSKFESLAPLRAGNPAPAPAGAPPADVPVGNPQKQP